MTEPSDPQEQIGRRAETAGQGLYRVAARRPVPDFDPEEATRVIPLETVEPRSQRPVLAVAAVLAAVLLTAGAVWWFGVGDGDADGDVTGPGPVGDLRPYLPTEVPDGLELSNFSRVDDPEQDPIPFAVGSTVLYGPDINDARVSLFLMEDVDPGDGEPVPVGSTTWRFDGDSRPLNSLIGPVSRSDNLTAFLLSPSLNRTELADIASGVSVTEDQKARIDIDALPKGWRRLGEADQFDNRGVLARYQDPARPDLPTPQGPGPPLESPSPGPTIVVSTLAGDRLDMSLRSLGGGGSEPVNVRGKEGLLVRGDNTGPAITWMEQPGVIVSVSLSDATVGEVLAIAESMAPVSPERADGLLRRSRLGDLTPAGDKVEVARGTFADGTEWVLRAPKEASGPLPQADFAATDVREGEFSASGDAPPTNDPVLRPAEVPVAEGRRYVAALVTEAVARVEVSPETGEPLRVPIVQGGGYRGFAASVADGPVTIVAYSEDGTELGRFPPASGQRPIPQTTTMEPMPPTTAGGG